MNSTAAVLIMGLFLLIEISKYSKTDCQKFEGCSSSSCSAIFNMSVPNVNVSAVENQLRGIQALINLLNSNLTSLEATFGHEENWLKPRLALIGYEISNIVQTISELNEKYSSTANQIFRAQDTVSTLLNATKCFKTRVRQCSSTTSSTSTMSTTNIARTTSHAHMACNPNPCRNGGTCTVTHSPPKYYICSCKAYTYGLTCSQVQCSKLQKAYIPTPVSSLQQISLPPSAPLSGGACVLSVLIPNRPTLAYRIAFNVSSARVRGMSCDGNFVQVNKVVGEPSTVIQIAKICPNSNYSFPITNDIETTENQIQIVLNGSMSSNGVQITLRYYAVVAHNPCEPGACCTHGICTPNYYKPSCTCSGCWKPPNCCEMGADPCQSFPSGICNHGNCTYDILSCSNPHCLCDPTYKPPFCA